MMKRCWIGLWAICLVGCLGNDPTQPRAGDQLIPQLRTSKTWDAAQGGTLALHLQLHGNGRAAYAILPGDRLPPNATITTEMQFRDAENSPIGKPIPIVFEPDC
ncbi:MAG: hypothetical protein LC104_17375 [Bacteroidales bacterium]|nr:hypothetical protein [Bacteroidales bacterium]